ncbi:MAG: TIGR00282 family metallophosphoesterase [Dehalococcoidales bacterium]|jgi:metallophosphoesterase (TIGR00282 family)|nr:TIGR00282 family metallophosphoesterase [Dehalococcoidales bacterium]MDD5604530.1 TIGR00282 family metallophosphoesterase [Dehalococcoidales bacterium]MDX9986282.1 TIGR00282 family metallophosphoesterase [Dehalococcoidales bacterium]NLE90821.1 YmdB family metallophosphoesterase [Dehalococcoidales bacterium]
MKILVIGDVIGKPGRQALQQLLPGLRNELNLDLVIANAENLAGGIGVTPETARELLQTGVDVLTSGNHIWAHKDIIPEIDSLPLVRPLNYPPGVPGKGYIIERNVMIVNLIGRVFIGNFDCPFRAMDTLLSSVEPLPKVIIVDFHAEATAEKIALGRYLDGRVSAVLGTHTHVGTIDHQVLPGGTAFVSDIGMTGPVESIIGDEIDAVLKRVLTMMPGRLSAAKGPVKFTAMLLDIDQENGKAISIERITKDVG